MAEPKPFASLSSGLLARKGAAVPAMRRQMLNVMGGNGGAVAMDIHAQDDLGWNDMGEDMPRQSDPLAVVGLTPMPAVHTPAAPAPVEIAPAEHYGDVAVPPVVEQRRVLAERVSAAPAPVPAPAETVEIAPVVKARKPVAAKVATPRKAKAAFTLRLDADRHLKLRLACAVDNRSAQQIVTEALDAYLAGQPQIAALADQLPRTKSAHAKSGE